MNVGPLERFRKVVRSKDREAFAAAALELRHWMMENDPHRPIYHFAGPESWTNDPNGPIYYRGKYHLFYQFDPIVDGQRSNRCWGHAVSEDLVHWEDWPIALWPDTPYDQNGVYSGNTVVDDNGHLCALYTGNVGGHRETYGIVARSMDDGLNWQKKMVMHNTQRPNDGSPVHWDGYLWREGKRWKQLIGGATEGENRQGAAWLWTSDDLEQWTLQKNIAPDIKLGEYWELPYLIRLGGKAVLMVGHGNPYWLGDYDEAQMHFQPNSLEALSIDNGNYYSFNVNMTDNQGPQGAERRLMHGWVTGPPSPTKDVPYWQGAHSIPRVISLKNGRVWQEPIPEMSSLRGEHKRWDDRDASGRLPMEGHALELQATFDPGTADVFGLNLRVSEDGSDLVRVFFDRRSGEFGVDGPTLERNRENLGPSNEGRSIKIKRQASFLATNTAVTMHIFLDRSIVEVFINGCAYTARAFSPADAQRIEVFSEGGVAKLRTLDIWEMKSIWQAPGRRVESC